MNRNIIAVAVIATTASGCYHAVADTGLAPSPQVIDKAWAHGFVYGLVPPSVVETASKYPQGVSKVETQHSFLNMLAQALTAGLYTPMKITVTCAGSGATGIAPADVTYVQAQAPPRSAPRVSPIVPQSGPPILPGAGSQAAIGAPRSESDRSAGVRAFAEANAHVGNHEWAKAEQSYQRAVLYDGSVAEYHAALGRLMMILHRWEDAQASFSAAVLLDVDNPEYRRLLKEVRSRTLTCATGLK